MTAVSRWLLSAVSPGPLLVRAVALGTGVAALVLCVPAWWLRPVVVVAAVLLAVGPAVAPGTPWVSFVEYLAVGVWFGATTYYRYEIVPVHVLALAFVLYAHHSACALAAALPRDAAVAPAVLVDWVVRTAVVLLASLPLALLVLALPRLVGRTDSVWLPVAGLVGLVVAGFGVAQLARDR